MEQFHTRFFFFTILLHQTVSCYSIHPGQSSITCNDDSPHDHTFCTKDSLLTNKSRDAVDGKKERIPWYLRMPMLPVLFATSPTLPDGECKRQVQKYLEELDNGTLWAVRMFDSSTKYPAGIVAGHTRYYGNFDECYQLRIANNNRFPQSDAEVIGSKYCLVGIEYRKWNASNNHAGPYHLEFDPNGSVWEAIEEKGDIRRYRRYLLELALCVPDACSASDVEKALDEPLKKIGMEQHISLKSGIIGRCQTHKDSRAFSIWAKLYCYIILGLLLLVGVSTWYDATLNDAENKENKSLAVDLLLCFSLKRNYASIVEIKYTHPGLDPIHFFRFLLISCGICGHRMLQYMANPIVNTEHAEGMFVLPALSLVRNGTMIVEVYFTFGGMLLSYYMLYELDKKKTMNFVAPIILRYFRLTPSYFIVIMFTVLVLPHLGSGPYWETKIGLESDHCADNWWTNILYINNYVSTDKLCMFQSWYVTVDYHLYIIALFVIYLFWKMPRKVGYPFLLAIIIGGSSITFYLSYFRNVVVYRALPTTPNVKDDSFFIEYYIKTHERLSTYFVGVLGGAIVYDHSLSPWRIPKPWNHLPFIPGVIFLSIHVMNMGSKYYNPNIIWTPMENALYASLSRLTLAVAMIIILIYMTVSDTSGIYYKLMNPRWAQPLAKLTYGAYLVHNIHHGYDIGTVRNARTYSLHNAIRDLVVDMVFSFSFAFILAMLIEGPVRKIEKRLINKRSNKSISTDTKARIEKSD